MAKIKSPTDENTVPKAENPAPETTASVPATAPQPEPVPAAEKPAPKKEKKAEPEPLAEPDELALDILRAFTGYTTLYVDRHGGAFAPDTSAAIRAGAVLYRNPFFKS